MLMEEFFKTEVVPDLGIDLVQPTEFEIWVRRYPLWRQANLRAARLRVETDNNVTATMALVKCFLKNETTSKMTDPRNISPRSDEFLSIIGPYMNALEHRLHNAAFLVKGLNLRQRDRKMRVFQSFSAFIETDYSRFDMTISQQWIEQVEQVFFRQCFGLLATLPEHALIINCLLHCLRTKGVSSSGLWYTVEGTRCSGDAHTSIGNGIINKFNTWMCLRSLPTNSWTSVHEGDDGLIGIDEPLVEQAINNLALLGPCGFVVKSNVSNSLENVGFCGRRFSLGHKLRSYADVSRTMDKIGTTLSQGDLRGLLRAKALSYHHTDAYTPVVGAFCRAVLSIIPADSVKTRHVVAASLDRWSTRDVLVFNANTDIKTDQTMRASVALSSSISVPQQIAAEAMFAQWTSWGFIPAEYAKIIIGDSALEAPDRHVTADQELLRMYFR
jgi:hypothetical protein